MEQIAFQFHYDYESIQKDEREREEKKAAKIAKLTDKFVKEATLTLPFYKMNISFNPTNITPLQYLGTVYSTLRIVDTWGILTVKNDALISNDWSKVIVSYPTTITDSLVTGNGWELALNRNWKVAKEKDLFSLSKVSKQ